MQAKRSHHHVYILKVKAGWHKHENASACCEENTETSGTAGRVKYVSSESAVQKQQDHWQRLAIITIKIVGDVVGDGVVVVVVIVELDDIDIFGTSLLLSIRCVLPATSLCYTIPATIPATCFL